MQQHLYTLAEAIELFYCPGFRDGFSHKRSRGRVPIGSSDVTDLAGWITRRSLLDPLPAQRSEESQ